MKWQPIETAPKDRKQQILTFGPAYDDDENGVVWAINNGIKGWYQCSFYASEGRWVGWPLYRQPTHWMPLPDAPTD